MLPFFQLNSLKITKQMTGIGRAYKECAHCRGVWQSQYFRVNLFIKMPLVQIMKNSYYSNPIENFIVDNSNRFLG